MKNMFFGDEKEYRTCPKCGYKFYANPPPKVCPNPSCLQPLETNDSFEDHIKIKNIQKKFPKGPEEELPVVPPGRPDNIKEMKVSRNTAASRIRGVRVKKKDPNKSLKITNDLIVIPSKGQYFKDIGIVTEDRIFIYNRNKDYTYLQELAINLNYIANSILGGEIDRLILKSEISNVPEHVLFLKEKELVFYIYGVFPIKQGNWMLRQLRRHAKDALFGKDLEKLSKDRLALTRLQSKIEKSIKYEIKEYMNLSDVISEREIPPVDDFVRFDYFGLSYKSISTISKILGDDLPIELNMDVPESQLEDMKESLVTAKMEAIAANTIANTNAVPVSLSVRLSYQHYRYMVFEKLKNDYFMYFLLEGNLKKARNVIDHLAEIVAPVIDKPFKGNLEPFSKMKRTITAFFGDRVFK